MKAIRLFLSALEWVFVGVASFWVLLLVITIKVMSILKKIFEITVILLVLVVGPPVIYELIPEPWQGTFLMVGIHFMAFSFVSFIALLFWKPARFQRIMNRPG